VSEDAPEKPIQIDYFTDVLCVWAWIAQARLDEVHRQWGGHVRVRHRYVDIFGDCFTKIPRQWGKHGGFEKFGEHVASSAARFEHCRVNPAIWTQVRPRSSMQAHLLLKAVASVAGQDAVAALALRIRRAFFEEATDIGDLDTLLEIAEEQSLDASELRQALRTGSAIAELSTDLRDAAASGVRGSPTWVLNEGRQLLYGNVGYRILSANIEELLKHPGSEASWC
jgi:predicted DsbA family dithiol-disulfide isomerase